VSEMSGNRICTDEDLHCYVDGELDAEARSRVQDMLEKDSSLSARVREYRMVDEAVRAAFDGVEPPRNRGRNAPSQAKRRGAVAAAVLLPAGSLAGWLGHSLLDNPDVQEPLAGGITLPGQSREHLNAMFHINVNEKAVMDRVLDRAEAILAAYANEDVQVEVVANAAGVDLLRADTSAVAPRVRSMMDKYDNLTFVACANTIKELKEQGVDVLLIDHTHSSETALDHVVDRLRSGWTYIKI